MQTIRTASADPERVREIERRTDHDTTAFLWAMGETIGDAARYVHMGLTSSDVVDTTLSLLTRGGAGPDPRATRRRSSSAVTAQAVAHKRTLMIGRTHGVHAEPLTFGFVLAMWVDEIRRHRTRLDAARAQMAYGKISGAVGTHAHVPPEIEERACALLGLTAAPVSTQILQRDRHAQVIMTLALLATSLEKFAVEIRHLQRTEVHEVEEPFGGRQARRQPAARMIRRLARLARRGGRSARVERDAAQAQPAQDGAHQRPRADRPLLHHRGDGECAALARAGHLK